MDPRSRPVGDDTVTAVLPARPLGLGLAVLVGLAVPAGGADASEPQAKVVGFTTPPVMAFRRADAFLIATASQIYRFNLQGRLTGHFDAGGPATFVSTHRGLEAWTATAVSDLDEGLHSRRRCALPEGWWWSSTIHGAQDKLVVASAGTGPSRRWGVFERRRCRVTDLNEGLQRLASDQGTVLFSPSLKRVAIAREPDQPSSVEIYAYPSLERLGTEAPPPGLFSAKFGGPGIVGLGDDGHLQWVSMSVPCYGFDDSNGFLPLDGAVFATVRSIVRTQKGTPRCLVGDEYVEETLAALELGVPVETLRIGLAEPGRLVILSEQGAWLILFPSTEQGFDYAAPRIHPLALGATAEKVTAVASTGPFLILLAEHQAWLVSAPKPKRWGRWRAPEVRPLNPGRP